jgi:DNA-binding beta-propeller fold protein YncE
MGEWSIQVSGSPKRRARRQVLALVLATSALLIVTAGALAVTGDLTQPAGTAGCVSEDGSGPCADGHALKFAGSVAVSPDGKSVYVGSAFGIARFNRNPTTGAITQPSGTAGCVSETGAGPCADGHGLGNTQAVAVSPDGKSVYVTSGTSNAVARFNRNTTTGAITQPAGAAGCISEDGSGPCADGHGLFFPIGVTVSPDGKSVYVASHFSNAVARFERNATTGAITQPPGTAGCVSEEGTDSCANGHGLDGASTVAVAPDGKSVYAASSVSDAVVRFNRSTPTGFIGQPAREAGCVSESGAGPCADGHALDGAFSVAVAPGGKSVYAASLQSDAVDRFNRSTTTGAIRQPSGTAGCVSGTGAGGCADGHALTSAGWVAVSPDGKNVYTASRSSDAVDRFNRNPTTGAITQPSGSAGCVSETGAGLCANGHALEVPEGVAVSPDGKSVYAASVGSDAVARFNRAP